VREYHLGSRGGDWCRLEVKARGAVGSEISSAGSFPDSSSTVQHRAVAVQPVGGQAVPRRSVVDTPWLTVAEAAQYIGLSQKALYHRVYRGQVSAHRFGRSLRFKRDDLDQAIEGRGLVGSAELQSPCGRPPANRKGA
jgi:excisionase family DNA binding protein